MSPRSSSSLSHLHAVLLLLVTTTTLTIFISRTDANDGEDDECKTCRFLVRSFREGLDRTEKLHFGGGNTDWEERKLGSFRTSETRFLESMEYACSKESEFNYESGSQKEVQFKCHAMAEDHEEIMESWFFKRQDSNPDLENFLCVEQLKKCCPEGYFGPECQACPGIAQFNKPCSGRGKCAGSSSRRGDGKCSCDSGYVGKMCSNCDSTHFPLAQNSTYIECAECYTGCAGGCTEAGPVGCRNCRHGWKKQDAIGCVDVNECLEGSECTRGHEKCINTEGSFKCECESGYSRDEEGESGECKLDVEEVSSMEKAESSSDESFGEDRVGEGNEERSSEYQPEVDSEATNAFGESSLQEAKNEQEPPDFRVKQEIPATHFDRRDDGEL